MLGLVLGPLHVDLLGLFVDLNRVHLTITANPAGGVLGSLFCGLANTRLQVVSTPAFAIGASVAPMVDVRDVDLEPRRVAELHRQGSVELVDVRKPYEWEAGRVAGARHVELERLAALRPERPVVFYCRVGARSAMAALAFRRAGYEAYSMNGGLEAWDAEGFPLEPPDGKVAPH